MKTLMLSALLVASFISVSAHAVHGSSVEVVKLNDGRTAKCETNADIATTGYRPGLPLMLTRPEGLILSFAVFGVVCEMKDEQLNWNVRPINDPFYDARADVTYTFKENKALLKNVKNGRPIGSQLLENNMMQILQFPLPLNGMTTKNQRRALANGETVQVVLNYHHEMSVVAEGEEASYDASLQGGAYEFSFTLTQDESGKLSASKVTVQATKERLRMPSGHKKLRLPATRSIVH